MKIFFAYRTAYTPNLRYIKEFEANSIYSWFTDNWESLCSDDYAQLLGTEVYGFPISIQPEVVQPKKKSTLFGMFRKKEVVVSSEKQNDLLPKTFQELVSVLEKGLYINQIDADENCIRVATDDDEIELAWFVFTEEYKRKNEEKVAIWFNDVLPTSFGETGKEIIQELPVAAVKGSNEGSTYFLSSPIYDGSNLEDMTVIKIEGVRMNNLVDFLRKNEIPEIEDIFYASEELNYLRKIANELDTNDLKLIFETFAKYPITEIQDVEMQEHTLEEIKGIEFNNLPEKSTIHINEHSAEISVNSIEIFYNYYLFIDDLWIEKNEELAKSIIHFGTHWDV